MAASLPMLLTIKDHGFCTCTNLSIILTMLAYRTANLSFMTCKAHFILLKCIQENYNKPSPVLGCHAHVVGKIFILHPPEASSSRRPWIQDRDIKDGRNSPSPDWLTANRKLSFSPRMVGLQAYHHNLLLHVFFYLSSFSHMPEDVKYYFFAYL